MNVAIIIPARFDSSRFPGKPLADICGKSLIQRVWERCIRVLPPSKVYVATDSDKIAAHCNNRSIQTVMTSSNCLTGTDRVWEASKEIDAEIYVNVQGDEPLIEPRDIKEVIAAAEKSPGQVVNAMCSITAMRSVTVPKVVARPDGRLLYMSRGAIDKQEPRLSGLISRYVYMPSISPLLNYLQKLKRKRPSKNWKT